MKNFIRINIIFFVVIGLFVSCKKDNFQDHVGPAICASANFQYVQKPNLSSTAIDLSATTMKLTAEFNEEVPWKITIKGKTSKSFKKFSGYGSRINVEWHGNPDTLVFFQNGETCDVIFSIACKDPITKSFVINTVSNFSDFDYLAFNGDVGALATLYGPPYGYGNPGTSTTMEAGLNSPQGGNCLCTVGTSATPVYYFGGYDLNIIGGLSSYVLSDPTKVYFNAFVNARGSQASIPVVIFKEGTVNRVKNILVYGDGWHYVSFPLSDANVVNPKNITLTSFTLNAYPNKGTSGAMCIDFVNFTNNGPFINPAK